MRKTESSPSEGTKNGKGDHADRDLQCQTKSAFVILFAEELGRLLGRHLAETERGLEESAEAPPDAT